MSLQRTAYYLRTLFRNIASVKGLSALLSSFGALWLCVEIADHFFKDTALPSLIESLWWLFFIIGIAIALATWVAQVFASTLAAGFWHRQRIRRGSTSPANKSTP